MLSILLVILAPLLSIIFSRAAAKIRRNNGRRKLPPGPTPLPVIGNLHQLTTLPHRGLQSLSKKYGPIMSLRLGQVPAVVVSSPEAAELFLKTFDTTFASRPRVQSSEYMSYGTKGMAFTEYGPYWRNVRKLCTLQLLSALKIESFAALRREDVASVVESLRASAAAREVVDISRKIGELIADMSCRMILGISLEDRNHLKELVHEAMFLSGAFNLSDYVPYLAPLDLQGYTRRMKKNSEAIDRVLEEIITEHERGTSEKGHRQKDFVDVLLSLVNQPMNPQDLEHLYIIDRTNIKAILLDMVAASFDTSAALIEWTFSELLKHPRVMNNLQRELERVVGMDKMVEEQDLEKLDYLDMVVKESFRLHPVAPLLVPRESMEDITIEGYFIPKKSRIIVNAWTIGRDPNVWSENVEEFLPERFVDKNIDLRGHDFRLLPFGSGRRGCPGVHLGLVNIRLVLAQLVHCFSWELPNGVETKDVDMSEKFGLSMGRANQLLAKPTYRLLAKTM
ncbi:Cytochrome P450 71A1 [Morus notabilis]|uniref:Cytochrome P450 71A1 n=2 Tax=Morus notabilis TaxID=981085 RepID=W9QXF9_9ROSA|nr:Cytochrome P450 71A1 [Morus notabilis]